MQVATKCLTLRAHMLTLRRQGTTDLGTIIECLTQLMAMNYTTIGKKASGEWNNNLPPRTCAELLHLPSALRDCTVYSVASHFGLSSALTSPYVLISPVRTYMSAFCLLPSLWRPSMAVELHSCTWLLSGLYVYRRLVSPTSP